MIARIDVQGEDYFAQNNVFYKTVHIIEQPKILVVSKKGSPLLSQLSTLYRVTNVQNVPQDLSAYTATIVDDLSAWTSQVIINVENTIQKGRRPVGIALFLLGALLIWLTLTTRNRM